MLRLAHAVVTAGSSRPSSWVLFLHGILGSGPNFRTFARRFVEAKPSVGAVLVDLRMHGASQGFPPPHTLDAAAEDLVRLEADLPGPVGGVVGHSFGGKVALAYLAKRPDVPRAWILDSNPGMRKDGRGSESTLAIVAMLERIEKRFPSREAFVERVVDEGEPRAIAAWLGQNLDRKGDELVFRLDLAAIRALLDDYFDHDLWPVAESSRATLDFVLGGKSRVFDEAAKERLDRLVAESGGRVRAHVLRDAGHWLHVDDPDGLFAVMAASV